MPISKLFTKQIIIKSDKLVLLIQSLINITQLLLLEPKNGKNLIMKYL